ncbi:MAG TPA: ATP-binding protein [Candidatus Kryptonia bacterium]
MIIAADILDFLFVFLPISSLILLAFRIGLAYGRSRGGIFIFGGGALIIFSYLFKIYFDFVFGSVDVLWLFIFTLGTMVGLALALAGTWRSYIFLESTRSQTGGRVTPLAQNAGIIAAALSGVYIVFFAFSGRPLMWTAAAVCYVVDQAALFGIVFLIGEFFSAVRKPTVSREAKFARILSAYYLLEPTTVVVATRITKGIFLNPAASVTINLIGVVVSILVVILMMSFIRRYSSTVLRQIKTTYIDTLRVRVLLYLFVIGSVLTIFLFIILLAAESTYGRLRLSTIESYAQLRLSVERLAATRVRSTFQDVVLRLQRSEDASDFRDVLTSLMRNRHFVDAIGTASLSGKINFIQRRDNVASEREVSGILNSPGEKFTENGVAIVPTQSGRNLEFFVAIKTRNGSAENSCVFAFVKLEEVLANSLVGLEDYGQNFRVVSTDFSVVFSTRQQEIGKSLREVVLSQMPVQAGDFDGRFLDLQRKHLEGFEVLSGMTRPGVGEYYVLTSTPLEFSGYECYFTAVDREGDVSGLFQPTNSLLVLAGLLIAGIFGGGLVTIVVAFRWSMRLEKEVQSKVQELRSSEDKYRRIVENPYIGSFIMVDRRLIFSNNRLAEILETDIENLPGSDLSAFVQKEDRAGLQSIFDSIISGEKSGDKWTVNALTASGRSISLSGYSSVINIGTKRGVQSLAVDSTAEFREKEKLEQFERLESMATLAAGIAHDFNNILQVVLGSSQLLQHSLEHTDLKKYADNITNVALRGSDLSKRLLTFSRHRGLEEKLAFDVNSIIMESIPLFEETFPRTIKIATQLTPEAIYVDGDQSQIQQVIFNLAVNARDAMPHGGTLTIKTEIRDVSTIEAEIYQVSPGLFAFVMVKDNGDGIPTELMSKVFEPFFTTKPPGRGTGLGLSVVYGIVRSHNGFLKVYSEVKKGTVFDIYLPLSDAGRGPKEEAGHGAVKESIATYGKKILFVDDEAGIREAAQVLLEQEGYKVLTAKDGVSAIETFKRAWHEIDLVVLDLNMPELSGREVLDSFTITNPDVRVLISTGYITPEEKAGLKGVVEVIEKPFDFDQLVQKVRMALERFSGIS